MLRPHLLWLVIKRSGADKALMGYLAVYLACAAVVLLFEPGVTTYADALWFLWAVSTTVGLGDITAVTHVGRMASVICSLYAIITTAIITGVVVDYFNEKRQHQLDASMTEFLYKLEHLPQLSTDELASISEHVRAFRTAHMD